MRSQSVINTFIYLEYSEMVLLPPFSFEWKKCKTMHSRNQSLIQKFITKILTRQEIHSSRKKTQLCTNNLRSTFLIFTSPTFLLCHFSKAQSSQIHPLTLDVQNFLESLTMLPNENTAHVCKTYPKVTDNFWILSDA